MYGDDAGLGDAAADLADAQDGVLGRYQLRELGMDRHVIRSQVRARRWRLMGTAVVLHRGPLTRWQQIWVGALHTGPGSAVCAWTGCELAGLDWDPRAPVHVVVARGHRIRRLPGVVVHESRRFDPGRDVHPSRNPVQTWPARSVVDACAWTRSGPTAVALLAAAVQQRIVRAADLAEVLDQAGEIRHRRLLLAVLPDIDSGAHSLPEIDFARACRTADLPEPQRQVVREANGRRYLDVGWPLADGTWLVVEIDGVGHLQVATYWADQRRSNALVIEGDRLLRLAGAALHSDVTAAMLQVADALVAFGVIEVVPAALQARARRGSKRPA